MSEPFQPPRAARRADAGPPPLDVSAAAIGASLAIVAGTAVLGLAAGWGWSLVAPRALLVMVSPRAAALAQVETDAFIAADVAFCLITLAGGVVSGALGYLLAVRRYGPLPMAGVLAGAVAAAYLARWVGEQSGLATFHHLLATLPAGATLHDSLTLGATGALAFWPLAAGLVAGCLAAVATGDARHRAPDRPPLLPPWAGEGGREQTTS
jgi:subtilisin family serine protease